MIKLGITGGIGSGKSVVSHILRLMNIPIYDCDSQSKQLLATDVNLHQELQLLIGRDLYLNDSLNKQKLAAYIFGNEQHLKAVNAIIHPRVKEDFYRWCLAFDASSFKLLGMESAILIDAGFENVVDFVINVSAPVQIRLKRAMQRDHSDAQLIQKRIDSQISEEKRCSAANFIVYNDDIHPLIPQLFSIVNQLKNNYK